MTQPRHQEAALEQLIELMAAEQEAADKASLVQQVSFSRVIPCCEDRPGAKIEQ